MNRPTLPIRPWTAVWLHLAAWWRFARPWVRGAALLLATILAVLLLAAAVALAEPRPLDGLWSAMVETESGGRADAVGDGGLARGVVQIHPVMVAEANRLARLHGLADRFTLADRLSPARSRRIWDLYLAHWGQAWCRRHRRTDCPLSVLARLWNGGPTGDEKPATLPYWAKVRAVLAEGG